MLIVETLEKWAMVTELISEMRQKGGWSGETHIQKSFYFLQDLLQVPCGYTFVFYKHGPFSFDLHDDLGRMRANLFLDVEPHPPYGPSFGLGRRKANEIQGVKEVLSRYGKHVGFISEALGHRDVRTLEQYSTALFVRISLPNEDPQRWIAEIRSLKPHINERDAKGCGRRSRAAHRGRRIVRFGSRIDETA